MSQWEKEETDHKKYLCIKESNEQKEKRKSDHAIKKLKKEGKVQSICGFLVCKEEVEDDDWTKSKKESFQRNRINRCGAATATAPPPISDASTPQSNSAKHRLPFDDSDSDEEEDYLEDILNFRPFCNALGNPIARRRLNSGKP